MTFANVDQRAFVHSKPESPIQNMEARIYSKPKKTTSDNNESLQNENPKSLSGLASQKKASLRKAYSQSFSKKSASKMTPSQKILSKSNTWIKPIDADTKLRGKALVFDLPMTYNDKVKFWIHYYQTNGKKHFTKWLERSQRYIPKIQTIFKEKGLPLDLAYLAMIESGLSPFANSSAKAVGYWQFIEPTAKRYGLKVSWWLDERRDIYKSTSAAATYLSDMHKMFNSWYLAAAGYNTGESRIKRLIEKHNSKNFWDISGSLVQETKDYVPKLIAAVLIAKAPGLYGFRDLNYKDPLEYEYFWAPGGTSLQVLAKNINFSQKELQYMNPELIRGYIPDHISGHKIRIPKGSLTRVSSYFKNKY